MSVDDLFNATQGRLQTDRPSDLQAKRDIWARVRPFINQAGLDPAMAIVGAIKDSRIVGIGEQHTNDINPSILYGIDHMRDFAGAGLTDLFVEMPTAAQPVFDKLNGSASARAGIEIPDRADDLMRAGVDRVVAQGAIELLRTVRGNSSQYFELWRAAEANGIRVHAVDNASAALVFSAPNDPRMSGLVAVRDRDMKAAIMAVMDQPAVNGARRRKGLAWLGLAHITGANSADPFRSVVALLRESGIPVTTFATAIALNEKSGEEALFTVGRYLNRVVAVPTRDTRSAANPLGAIRFFPGANIPRLDAWDYAIIFPHHCALVTDQDQHRRLAC
jgi:hypothetical protein